MDPKMQLKKAKATIRWAFRRKRRFRIHYRKKRAGTI